MKLRSAALATLLLGLPATNYADSLGRVYELALKNDYQFQRAKAMYQADAELATIARAGLLPKIKADYTVRNVQEDSIIRQLITPAAGSLVETDVSLNRDVTDSGWQIKLEQPVFDAPAWYGYKQGKSEALIASTLFEKAKQDLVLRVVNSYLNVLRAQDNLAAARAQERAFAGQLQKTQQRFDTGLIPVIDVTESQSAFDLVAVRTLEEAINVEVALEELATLTGEEHQVLNLLRGDFVVRAPEPNDVDQWAQAAGSDNLQVIAARHTQAAAKDKRKAAKWEHSPTLTFGAFASSVNTSGTNDSSIVSPFILAPDQESDTFGLELRLEIPLYEGGATSANRRRAEHLYQASRNFVSETRRKATIQSRQLFLTVKSDMLRIEGRRSSILSAKAALDAAEAGYSIGTRNIVDVLNAQNTLFSAERDYANSRYDYIENSFRLRATSASLSSGDLYRLDAFLNPPSNQQATQRIVR